MRAEEALSADSAWAHAVGQLVGPYDFAADTTHWYGLALYSCPLGSGHRTTAGAGMRHGLWQTFGVHDGLPSSFVGSITQDRDGSIWFTTDGAVCRFDGESFTTYGPEDGMPGWASEAVAGPRGDLWLLFWGHVAHLDGERITHLTVDDGLSDGRYFSVCVDRQDNVWIGGKGTVHRFDGQTVIAHGSEEGLPDAQVGAIVQGRDGGLWLAAGSEICRFDGKRFTVLTPADGFVRVYPSEEREAWYHGIESAMVDDRGRVWFATMGDGVVSYDGEGFTRFTTADGLVGDFVHSVTRDLQGNLWFGTQSSGVSRYDGEGFTSITVDDGLGGNQVNCLFTDRDGYVWFGAGSGGLSRYDGVQFTHLTPASGMPSSFVFGAAQDRHGRLWFGARDGLCRLDGDELQVFTTEDGLAGSRVTSILEDSRGEMWFGMSWLYGGRGVTRYNGEEFVVYTEDDGLASDHVQGIAEDSEGHLWFATPKGASRYDGGGFTTFTSADGLMGDYVNTSTPGSEGDLWFGTQAGLSRYRGGGFKHVMDDEGKGLTQVRAIHRDRAGVLWFASREGLSRYDGAALTTMAADVALPGGSLWGGSICDDDRGRLWIAAWGLGVCAYDGEVLQILSRRDGLTDNGTQTILEADDGTLWITSDGGVTGYRPGTTPPRVRVTEVVADQSYGPVSSIALPSTQRFVRLGFQGRSLTTRPGQMVYLYRLSGHDEEWRQTRDNHVEYTGLPRGTYLFEVKAVDRDLNYSVEAAQVRVEIRPPYGLISLSCGLGLALVAVALAGTSAFRRRRALLREQAERLRAQELLNQELEEELQTAHDMQMRLMPEGPPQVEGLDVAGRCVPYNHVGGDLYQYFVDDGRLSVCVADVTGHAMEAAVPVMVFSGILESEIAHGHSPGELFGILNRTLHRRLDSRTFVCFSLAEIDVEPTSRAGTRALRLCNSGIPYLLHYRAASHDVVEVQIDAYPLGVRADTEYASVQVDLAPGDRVVFCSDGIAEAANARDEVLGFERAAAAVRTGCAEELSAEAIIDRLIGQVQAFAGDRPLEDDMTVVVVGVQVWEQSSPNTHDP